MTVSSTFGFVLLETERVTTFGEIRALPFLVQAGGITVTTLVMASRVGAGALRNGSYYFSHHYGRRFGTHHK